MKLTLALCCCLFSATVLLGQGASFRSSGCYNNKLSSNCQDSIAIINALLKAEPENARYYYMRSGYEYSCKFVEAAIKSCDTAIALDSTNASFYCRRSYVYMYVGKLRNALQDAHSAVKLDTTDATNWCNLASVYGEFKIYDSILVAVDKALLINPKNYDALCIKGQHLKFLNRFKEAFSLLNAAIKINPKDSYAHHIRIGAYGNTGKYEEAIADIDKVLSIDSCYTELYWYKGNYYYALKKPELAMQCYTLSIEKHDRSVLAYFSRAWLYAENDEKDKAGSDLLQAALLGHSDAVEILEANYPAYYTKYLEQRKK